MLEWIFLTNRMRYEDIFLSSEISSERCNFSSMRNEQRIFGNLVANSMNFSLEDTDKLFEEELTMLILHEVSAILSDLTIIWEQRLCTTTKMFTIQK